MANWNLVHARVWDQIDEEDNKGEHMKHEESAVLI